MKNRAKCKLCHFIIESFHSTDYVSCKCGEIAVDGGPAMLCYAKDFANFVRVDDHNNEIVTKVIEKSEKEIFDTEFQKLSLKDKHDMLKHLIKSYENMPDHAIHEPISTHDLWVVLNLFDQMFDDLIPVEKNK